MLTILIITMIGSRRIRSVVWLVAFPLLETVTRGLMMQLQLSWRCKHMYIVGGASGGQTVTYY